MSWPSHRVETRATGLGQLAWGGEFKLTDVIPLVLAFGKEVEASDLPL